MSDWLSKAEEWKGIKSVLDVCRKRSDNGKETQEKVFYISSLDVDIQTLSKCVRGHWEVEKFSNFASISVELGTITPEKAEYEREIDCCRLVR